MYGIAGGRSTRSRMNSGTHTVSVSERPPAHVCRREQLPLSQTLGSSLSVVAQWLWSLSLDLLTVQSRYFYSQDFTGGPALGYFIVLKQTNKPTAKRIPLFPVVISLKLERSWEKGGDPCWLLQRLEASDMEEDELLISQVLCYFCQTKLFLRVPCY